MKNIFRIFYSLNNRLSSLWQRWKKNKIYAAWNLGNPQDYNIERRMINEFMVQNPGVEVEVIERPSVDEEGNESDVVGMSSLPVEQQSIYQISFS